VITGGVAPSQMASDPVQSTGYILDDLSNGTGLATATDTDTVECDPFLIDRNPVADIVWVVDESISMEENQQDIINHAKDFFSRAQASGLDFRMGVTSVADPNTFDPITVKPGKFCGKMMGPPSDTDEDDGGTDRFLLPSERAIFESCIANPPYNETLNEYGLANALEAVLRHLPRKDNDKTKIRPNASLAIIIASDEAPQELKGGTYQGVTGPDLDLEGCNLTPSSQKNLDGYLKPWTDLFLGKHPTHQEQGRAMVHLIGGLCQPSCSADMGVGYIELVKATGGIAADICQKDLGTTLQIIIDSISGAASPVILEYVPISASLAAALGQTQLQRSRVNGFDYVGFSNSIVFIGVEINKGDLVVASYRRWVKQELIE
jgi:hypothetical protein